MKKKISSNDLFDVLSNVKKELDGVIKLNAVPVSSALYAFVFNAGFSVTAAINHLDEFKEE